MIWLQASTQGDGADNTCLQPLINAIAFMGRISLENCCVTPYFPRELSNPCLLHQSILRNFKGQVAKRSSTNAL